MVVKVWQAKWYAGEINSHSEDIIAKDILEAAEKASKITEKADPRRVHWKRDPIVSIKMIAEVAE